MADPTTDREILEATWRTYDEEFAEHVGDVVTPYEYVDADEQVDWAARIFMFGYALGSIAGAQSAPADPASGGTDAERVEAIVDDVIAIHESDDFAVSSSRIRDDFLE